MIWFIIAFMSILFLSFESLIDKLLVVNKEKSLDPLVASFFRNFAFFVIIAISGVLGVFGKMNFFATWIIFVLGAFWILNSLAYDFLLKNIEISRSSSITYIFPLLLLPLDILIFGEKFLPINVAGIFLLVLGSLTMSLSFSKGTLKNLFSWKVYLFLFIKFIILAFSLILFREYNILYGLNEVSFYFSVWIFVILTYLPIMFFKGKMRKIVKTASENKFLLKTFVSKSFDVGGSILSLIAITFTNMTKVEAVGSFFPLLVLIFAFIFQKLGFNLKENFSIKTTIQKIIGITLIIFGSIILIF